MKNIWKSIKKPARFAEMLRQAASKPLEWKMYTQCGVGQLLACEGIDIDVRPYCRLWSEADKHPAIIALRERYGLTQAHIRAIEMTNDHYILKRLAYRDIFPPGRLYRNAGFQQAYMNEIAAVIEECKKKREPKIKLEMIPA